MAKASKSRPEMHLVLSDHHYPYQCPLLEQISLEFIRDTRPNTIHLLGDLIDFYQISRFEKDPQRVTQLQHDIDLVVDYLHRLREAAPTASIVYAGGNHEDRLRRYLWSEAPALANLKSLQIPELFGLHHFRITWHHYPKPYEVGDLLLTHGIRVSKWSAYTARSHYEKYGCHLLHGHTHRLGAFFHTTRQGQFAAWENGCLCRLDPDYTEQPDWQNGFSVVWKASSGRVAVDQVHVVNGRYFWQGNHHCRRS